MKRFLSLLVVFCMLLSLAACSDGIAVTESGKKEETKTEASEKTTEEIPEADTSPIVCPQGFSVGWAREIISPEKGTGLGGYGNPGSRLSNTILDDLMLTCTALCDGENVLLLFSCDLTGIGGGIAGTAAEQIQKAHGVPKDHILFNATHTHSAPVLNSSDFANGSRYTRLFYLSAVKAAGDALRDLENATVSAGKGETENLNFVRRYVFKATGTWAGGEVGAPFDPETYAHESEADPTLQIIKFDRETKKDVVLCNWQCHPTGPGGESDTRVSADWIGSLRATVEKEADVLFSYHQGSAGNIGQSSRLTNLPKWGGESYLEHGKQIAKVALSVLQDLSSIQSGKIQVKQAVISPEYKPEILSGEQKKLFSSTIRLYAVSCGDFAFGCCPGEPHDTVGKKVKTDSPYRITFFTELTNGANGYIPADFAYPNGGYEVKSTNYAAGTAEMIADAILSELNALYPNRF